MSLQKAGGGKKNHLLRHLEGMPFRLGGIVWSGFAMRTSDFEPLDFARLGCGMGGLGLGSSTSQGRVRAPIGVVEDSELYLWTVPCFQLFWFSGFHSFQLGLGFAFDPHPDEMWATSHVDPSRPCVRWKHPVFGSIPYCGKLDPDTAGIDETWFEWRRLCLSTRVR